MGVRFKVRRLEVEGCGVVGWRLCGRRLEDVRSEV